MAVRPPSGFIRLFFEWCYTCFGTLRWILTPGWLKYVEMQGLKETLPSLAWVLRSL